MREALAGFVVPAVTPTSLSRERLHDGPACARSTAMVAPGVQIGRPKVSIRKDAKRLNEPTKERGGGTDAGAAKATPKRKTKTDEVPMYKVILLGDEDYDENHVVTQIIKIVQLEKRDAQKCYMEAQQLGEGLICVVTQEHAEFYVVQLKRQEIFVRLEEDV